MNNNYKIEQLIVFFRINGTFSDLEKDILDSYNILQEFPFDNDKAKKQIWHNSQNYPDVSALVDTEPTTIVKRSEEITEQDRKYILGEQLNFLVLKEFNENSISLYKRGHSFQNL